MQCQKMLCTWLRVVVVGACQEPAGGCASVGFDLVEVHWLSSGIVLAQLSGWLVLMVAPLIR